MNLSMKWLSDYVDIDVPIRQYAADMTMSGSKVEGFEKEGEGISGVVIGHVLEVTRHQDADSLFICKVDTGLEAPLQIVTAATNVVAGAMVAVFTDGAVTATGQKIKKGKLRGEVSEGMLVSLDELGLTHGDFPYAVEDGIFLIEEECHKGQDALEAIGLNDTVVEFEITPNRPDCLAVLGLARETAALYQTPFRYKKPQVKGSDRDVNDILKVRVENQELCLRYAAAAVTDVKIEPSPRWMRERLRASGVRSINNIVDITNYVMLEYGHPMHAFDLIHVAGASIVVRNARAGETITTLDGVERTLSPEMLVIADEKAPSAVAGVMGGEFSGIYDTTQTIIFESACFSGPSVRKTAKKLGMRTESSSRFEKGLDPENAIPALLRACELVELLGAGKVAKGIVDVKSPFPAPPVIDLDAAWICKFLGLEMPAEEMKDILRRLEFQVDGDKITPPSFRGDVKNKYDLAEEVARFYGYDKIPSTTLRGEAKAQLTGEQKFTRAIHQTLLAQGLSEITTYSFISPKAYDQILLPADSPLRESVIITNPLGEDTGVMRTTALPSMLDILARNLRARTETATLYEVATEYLPTREGQLPEEPKKIILGMYGPEVDFYALKGVVEALLETAGITDFTVTPVTDSPMFHPGRCAALAIGGKEAGLFGQIHPSVCENYKCEVPLYAADLSLAALLENASGTPVYRQMPRYPASTRDLALVCDESVPHAQIVGAITGAMSKILEDCTLFDVYRSAQLGAGKKSLAYSLTLRAADRTLTDEECDKAVQKALRALEAVGVSLRS